MKESDKLKEEIDIVVKALEREGLSEEQRSRGWKRYDELQDQLQAAYRAEAEAHIRFIRKTLNDSKNGRDRA